MMDNILLSKLYRPGNISYVSRSGGMSNELNNIVSRASNGTCEGKIDWFLKIWLRFQTKILLFFYI